MELTFVWWIVSCTFIGVLNFYIGLNNGNKLRHYNYHTIRNNYGKNHYYIAKCPSSGKLYIGHLQYWANGYRFVTPDDDTISWNIDSIKMLIIKNV